MNPPATKLKRYLVMRRGFPLLPTLAILPAFLGGATARWSEGIVLLLFGIVLFVRPPRVSLGRPLEFTSLAFFVCALAAFLPANWFAIPQWRTVVTGDLGIPLAGSITPQPWLTLEAMLLLAAGLAWFYYTAAESLGSGHATPGNPKRHRNRPSTKAIGAAANREHFKTFCFGIALFAGACVFFRLTGIAWPFRNANYQFGPFPNRNQSGDVLAISLTLMLARVHDDFRHGNKIWIAWACAAVLVMMGLVLSFSRAAVILSFGAVIVWIICLASVRNSGIRLAVGAAMVLILWSAFLFGGGDTLNRFLPAKLGGSEFMVTQDLRWSIQKDALLLGASSPLPGAGLGNFESEFWFFHRALGTANYHVLHPESDWVWLRVEMGWLAVVLVVIGMALIIARIVPLGKDPSWRLRAAAASGGLIFALHGAVDVSAHRLGTAFPALFLCSLALVPGKGVTLASSRLKLVFRAAGVVFVLVGAAWFIGDWFQLPLPGRVAVEIAKKQVFRLEGERGCERAIAAATSALRWAPLDWELYYARAVASAVGNSDFKSAIADFRRARYLNPISPSVPYNEGAVWLVRRPALALPAWLSALKRAGESRAELFEGMLASASANPLVRGGLKERAHGDTELTLVLLGKLGPEEFRTELAGLLHDDPELFAFSALQKQTLFRLWAGHADTTGFLEKITVREEWLRQGWPYAADCLAARQEYQRAYEMARKFMPPPVLPQIKTAEPISKLQRDLFLNPTDFVKAYALYDLQMRLGNPEQALQTLQKSTARKECPAYFFALKSTLHADQKKWKEAWESLKRGGLIAPPKSAPASAAEPPQASDSGG